MDDDLQQIVAAQAGIQTLEARFAQTKTLSLFDETIESSGTIVIEKPDFYCWTYEEPERSVFYVDGQRSGSFEPGSDKKNEFALDDRAGLAATIRSVTSIITGNLQENTRSEYRIVRNPSSGGTVSFTFHPQSAQILALFEQVTIRFDEHTWLARDLEIAENNGDTSFMIFDGWRSNIPVNRSELLE